MGVSFSRRLFIAFAAVLFFTAPADANVNVDAPVETSIALQADAPVTIVNCAAVANDYVNRTVSPPAYAYTQLRTELTFKNTGTKDATAIRFGFVAQDSFNKVYGTTYGTIHGTFSPGTLIQPHRSGLLNALQPDASVWVQNVNSEDLGRVLCYVSDVRFADGSVWSAPAVDTNSNAFSFPPNDLWKGAGTPDNPL